MSAKLGATSRPPENISAGESARVRVVATTISTWLVPGAVAATGTRKPCGAAHAARLKAVTSKPDERRPKRLHSPTRPEVRSEGPLCHFDAAKRRMAPSYDVAVITQRQRRGEVKHYSSRMRPP